MTEELVCDVPSWTFVSFVVKVLESAIKGASAPRIRALGLCAWGRVFDPDGLSTARQPSDLAPVTAFGVPKTPARGWYHCNVDPPM